MITHQKYATHIFLVLFHLPVVNMHINPLDRHQRLSTARRATVIDFRSGSRWRWITDMDVEGGKRERGRERNAIRKDSPGLRANQARGEGGRQTEREKSLAPVLVEKGWTAGERTRW
jgi:hypothetical protein